MCFVEVNSATITNIIFVFEKDEVVSGNYPCKGMAQDYIIRYQYGTGQLTWIPFNECLPFPCSYPNSPTCVSYSKQIYSGIYDIRHAIVRSMCQNSEKIGQQFIVGSTSFKLPLETWIFMVDYCRKNSVSVHGPFKSYRKHLQMRSHLDFNSIKVAGEVYLITFQTRCQFNFFLLTVWYL